MQPNLKIRFNFSIKKILKIVEVLVIVSSCLGMIYITYFLYNNFYISLTESQIIIELRDKVAIETVNAKKFDNIIKNIDKKTASKEAVSITDLFR
jgi:hypothetical protein